MPVETTQLRSSALMDSWQATLREQGVGLEAGSRPSDGLTLRSKQRWAALNEAAQSDTGPDAFLDSDTVGFWKPVQNGSSTFRTFEIPGWVVTEKAQPDPADFDEALTLGQMTEWALAARAGNVPPGWQPPERDQVESWLPGGALTVQAGGQVRQGEIILRPDCWALQFPLLSRVPHDLPEFRLHALRELLWEAQSHWALVRFGNTVENSLSRLVVKVDFTGAPHSEQLFSAGLDVLRHVVGTLVETVDVLAATSVVLESLSLDRAEKQTNERIRP